MILLPMEIFMDLGSKYFPLGKYVLIFLKSNNIMARGSRQDVPKKKCQEGAEKGIHICMNPLDHFRPIYR